MQTPSYPLPEYARLYLDPAYWTDPFVPLHYDSYPAHDYPAMPTPSPSAPSPDITQSIRSACANTARASRTSKQEGGPRPREKKHACWMCEKSFDRPSTLRKVRRPPRYNLHLAHPRTAPPRPHRRKRCVWAHPRATHLTPPPAFVCETCGRRFGVASNLNRHVKRCILKPVNAANRPQMTTPPAADTPLRTTDSPSVSTALSRASHKRTRDGAADTASPPDSPTQAAPKPAKRRRRAPSPSQWIPQSLAEFNITPAEYTKPTPVPLPPVTAYKDPSADAWVEERNSWDDTVGALPYHPCGWKGTLPGPGISMGKDVMNLGLVNGGTYVMGRLVMV